MHDVMKFCPGSLPLHVTQWNKCDNTRFYPLSLCEKLLWGKFINVADEVPLILILYLDRFYNSLILAYL